MNSNELDPVEGLGDLKGLQDGMATRFGRDAAEAGYYAEYGERADNSAMEIHIFASRDHFTRSVEGKLLKDEWGGRPRLLAVRDALNDGLLYFTEKGHANSGNYIPELQSFSVTVPGLGLSIDPGYHVSAFFARVEAKMPPKPECGTH